MSGPSKFWQEAFEEGQKAEHAVFQYKEHTLARIAGLENKMRTVLEKIYDTAKNGLETGGTWSETDRNGMLEDALKDIMKICERQFKKHE